MRLEPLSTITFTTPEAWSVELAATGGVEAQSFLIAEGRCRGRLSGRYRGANFPRRRTDGTLVADFRGVVETDDGAAILFSWHGYARLPEDGGGRREIVASMSLVTDDERYAWLNTAVCAVTGEVRPVEGGDGFEVALEVAELVRQ